MSALYVFMELFTKQNKFIICCWLYFDVYAPDLKKKKQTNTVEFRASKNIDRSRSIVRTGIVIRADGIFKCFLFF